MRFLRYSLSGLFLLSATVALLIVAVAQIYFAVQSRLSEQPQGSRSRERVFTVQVLRAEEADVAPVLTTYGQVDSRRKLDLRAASAGTIVYLSPSFVDGGRVLAGEKLLQVDPSDAQSALERARSDLSDARFEARDAARAEQISRDELKAAEDQAALRQRVFDRQRDLAQRGVGAAASVESAEIAASSAQQSVLARRQALVQAQTRIAQAQSRITRAELAQSDAQRHLDDTALYAEFDGVLTGVSAARGSLVAPNERVAQLIDPEALDVSFRLPTSQYARLLQPEGDLLTAEVTARLDLFGANLTGRGTISRDSAAVETGQTGRLLFARLDQSNGLKPGDFVQVDVAEPVLRDVVTLPSSALAADGTVLILGPDNRLEQAGVTLLRRQGDRVLVRGQALAGRRVVAARTPLLGAGIKVTPLEPGAGETLPAAQDSEEMVELTPERRARLRAFVQSNTRIPQEAKDRLLEKLAQTHVPARMLARLESRMGD